MNPAGRRTAASTSRSKTSTSRTVAGAGRRRLARVAEPVTALRGARAVGGACVACLEICVADAVTAARLAGRATRAGWAGRRARRPAVWIQASDEPVAILVDVETTVLVGPRALPAQAPDI